MLGPWGGTWFALAAGSFGRGDDRCAEGAKMKHLVAILPLVLLLCIILAGCEQTPPATTSGVSPGPPAPPGAPPPPPAPESAPSPAASPGQAALPPETKFGVFAGGIDDLAARPAAPATPPQATTAAPPPADPNTERVTAQAGVGAKGRSLDAYQGGYLVTPAKAYFAAKERIVFEIQFPSQYKLYKAGDGVVPKDFDDLKAKVLDPYQIKLPPLPQGHRYVWDAEKEELQVERPKPQ